MLGFWLRILFLGFEKWFVDCESVGGAERLIVDAAVELVSHGHKVHVFTSHHDKDRCFEETISGLCFSLLQVLILKSMVCV